MQLHSAWPGDGHWHSCADRQCHYPDHDGWLGNEWSAPSNALPTKLPLDLAFAICQHVRRYYDCFGSQCSILSFRLSRSFWADSHHRNRIRRHDQRLGHWNLFSQRVVSGECLHQCDCSLRYFRRRLFFHANCDYHCRGCDYGKR